MRDSWGPSSDARVRTLHHQSCFLCSMYILVCVRDLSLGVPCTVDVGVGLCLRHTSVILIAFFFFFNLSRFIFPIKVTQAQC